MQWVTELDHHDKAKIFIQRGEDLLINIFTLVVKWHFTYLEGASFNIERKSSLLE